MRNEGFRCGLLGRDRDLGRALPKSVGDDACIVPETLHCRKPPSGGRKRPPYIAARNGIRRGNGSPGQTCRQAEASIGPCAGGLAVFGFAVRVPYIVGRAFTPAGEGCGGGDAAVLRKRRTAESCNAARPGRFAVIWKDIGAARRRTPPSSLTRCHLLYRGDFWGGSCLTASPARGGGCAARRRRRGGIAALRRRYPVEPGRTLPCDDLRAKSRHFVLCAPKRRLRAAVLASSRKPCAAANPKRRAKTPALHCGPGTGYGAETAANHHTPRRADAIIGPCEGHFPQGATLQKACGPAVTRTCRRHGNHHTSSLLLSRPRGMVQPFSFRNCSINATSLSTPSGGMAL